MKLYYYYGVMGSSKTANALMFKFNLEQKNLNVLLLKPALHTRDKVDGKVVVKTRIGLYSDCTLFEDEDNLVEIFKKHNSKQKIDVVMVDECQLAKPKHIDELKEISLNTKVYCYGLKNNFKNLLFAASKRLFELADEFREIDSVCECGKKATVNALIMDGKIITEGESDILAGEDVAFDTMCYHCFNYKVNKQNK